MIASKIFALIGPPGSGKGSYGKMLSKTFGMPIVTVSDVLRESSDPKIIEITSSGRLVDDAIVNDELRKKLVAISGGKHTAATATENESLLENNAGGESRSKNNGIVGMPTTSANQTGCILDGFPRTMEQVHLMNQTWPTNLGIDLLINLDVPNQVCERKLLGRRVCARCNAGINVSDVRFGKFNLPPVHCGCGSGPESWKKRPDDASEDVVRYRLELHDEKTKPILRHYRQNHPDKLLDFAPYNVFPISTSWSSSCNRDTVLFLDCSTTNNNKFSFKNYREKKRQ